MEVAPLDTTDIQWDRPVVSETVWAIIPCADISPDEFHHLMPEVERVADRIAVILNSTSESYQRQTIAYLANFQKVEVVKFSSRLGKAASVRSGLGVALQDGTCATILQIDGHLKQDPSQLEDLVGSVGKDQTGNVR
jgi:hypothetical protein